MTAFKPANILLPKETTDMSKWAVVACDQYTSEPDYWAKTEEIVGDAPSTLKITLPEIYLEQEGVENRISKIQSTMNSYLSNDFFKEYENAIFYIERKQDDGKVRAGIVGAIDLEMYDYRKGSKSQVRATEATVVERIPPRIKVRQGAPVELPHIMILIDDDMKTVIEPIEKVKDSLTKLYDFSLMQKGGEIKGWLLGENEKNEVLSALEQLSDLDSFNKKYDLNEDSVLLYAMGDGNHSLATAKEFYEQLKAKNPGVDLSNHPARYALVEIVNLHSPALEFEAIHRIVTEIDRDKLMAALTEKLGITEAEIENAQSFDIVADGVSKKYYVKNELSKLTVGSLQLVLDEYIKENGGKIDYIHGIEVIENLSANKNSLGFVLPDMQKSELFPTVICDGALPRKTFSMGHAWDKRYYVEARKITL